MGGRYYLERWEAEQKAMQDNQQQNEQPLQQEDQPNDQQVNDQVVEIEPHGGNANEAQENPQTPSLLDYQGPIPKWQRTKKGSGRGKTNQDDKGRDRGGSSTMGKAKEEQATALLKKPVNLPTPVRSQAVEIGPNKSNANKGQGRPRRPRRLLLLEPEEEMLEPEVKSQAVEIGPNKGNANKGQGKQRRLLLLEPEEEMLEPKNKWPTQKHSGRDKTNQAGKARSGGGGSTKGKAPEVQAVSNLDEENRKKAQAKNVGHISQGCKGKSLWKKGEDSDSDSEDDNPSFSLGTRPRSARPRTFVGMD